MTAGFRHTSPSTTLEAVSAALRATPQSAAVVDGGSGRRERLDERLGQDTDLLGPDRPIPVEMPREPPRVVEREAATVGARIDGMPLPPVWPSG